MKRRERRSLTRSLWNLRSRTWRGRGSYKTLQRPKQRLRCSWPRRLRWLILSRSSLKRLGYTLREPKRPRRRITKQQKERWCLKKLFLRRKQPWLSSLVFPRMSGWQALDQKSLRSPWIGISKDDCFTRHSLRTKETACPEGSQRCKMLTEG